MWTLCLTAFVLSSFSPSMGARIQAVVTELHAGDATRDRRGTFADGSRRRSNSHVKSSSSSHGRSNTRGSSRRRSSSHGHRHAHSHRVVTMAGESDRRSKHRHLSTVIIGGHVDSDGTVIESQPNDNSSDDGNFKYEDVASNNKLEDAFTIGFDGDGGNSDDFHGPTLESSRLTSSEGDHDYDISPDGITDEAPIQELDNGENNISKILSGKIAAPEDSENHMNPEVGRGMVTVRDLEVQATAEKFNITPTDVMSRGLPLVTLADTEERTRKRRAGARFKRASGIGFTPWPRTVIPYKIHTSLPSSGRQAVETALLEIKRATCLSFQEKDRFASGPVIDVRGDDEGCYASHVGYTGKEVKLNLAAGCQTHGIAVHEFLHVLGKHHEQTRGDRDRHVRIAWNNIDPNKKQNFNKQAETSTKFTNYDFGSIMHYGEFDFSVNGQATIVRRDGSRRPVMGQRKSLSLYDALELNAQYCGDPHLRLSWWLQYHYDQQGPMQLTAEAHSADGAFAVVYSKWGSHVHSCSTLDDFRGWYRSKLASGYKLTALKYSEQSDKYCGTMSTHAGIERGQWWRTSTVLKRIEYIWGWGGRILDVNYGKGVWTLVSGKTPELPRQLYQYCEWSCAVSWISQGYQSGYKITAIARDDARPMNRFLVVMSETPNIEQQDAKWKHKHEISGYIRAVHSRGHAVTSIVESFGGRFLIVSSLVRHSKLYPNFQIGDHWAIAWDLKV